MDCCKECHYFIGTRARTNLNHCHHCHFIAANRTELNCHLRVSYTVTPRFNFRLKLLSINQIHLSTYVHWPRTTESHEDSKESHSVPDVEATQAKRSSSSFEGGGDAESSFKKKVDESINMTTSTLNEDVTMNSDDFMNTSIDTSMNISINSEDYENYINGEDFKPSDKCSELEGLDIDDGPESDVNEEPSEPSATVDDILAKYSHLQSPGSPASLETSKPELQHVSRLKESQNNSKQEPRKATDHDLSMKPNAFEGFKQSNLLVRSTKLVTPKNSKSTNETKPKTPRSKKNSPKKVKAKAKSPMNQTTPLRKGSPKLNPSEGKSESKSLNQNEQKQGPKGGKTPIRAGKKVTSINALNNSIPGIQSSTQNKQIFSPAAVKSQPGGSPASGKKPGQLFQCEECNKTLSSKYNLNKHKLIHEKRRASGAT